MVGLQPERRGGASGKLSGDPAVKTAAVALLLGLSDPLELLARERHDYNTVVEVINKADELRATDAKQMADYTAQMTANKLAPLLQQTLTSIARSMRG